MDRPPTITPHSLPRWLLLAVAAIAAALLLAAGDAADAVSARPDGLWLLGYGNADAVRPASHRRITRSRDGVTAAYGFRNFDNTDLEIRFAVTAAELDRYRQQYGYSDSDLERLLDWQKTELESAYRRALVEGLTQAELDRIGAEVKSEYRRMVRNLLRNRGFRYRGEDLLVPDIPGIVRRNVDAVRPVALEIAGIARRRGYDDAAVVGTALSLVQTGLDYEDIPLRREGRVIGGIYPPVVALTEGRGDCDSKTALMASILLNWDRIRLVGVGIPDHYLLGVLQIPAKGDAYVEYGGLQYVLMEPAGPAWLPPGVISDYTLDILAAGGRIALEPLTAN